MTAYQTLAEQDMAFYGVPVTSVSQNLLKGLWPQSALTGGATPGNYFNLFGSDSPPLAA
jgi:hypothetical protein